MVALKEIRKYQKSTDLLIRKLPFARLVSERGKKGSGAWELYGRASPRGAGSVSELPVNRSSWATLGFLVPTSVAYHGALGVLRCRTYTHTHHVGSGHKNQRNRSLTPPCWQVRDITLARAGREGLEYRYQAEAIMALQVGAAANPDVCDSA